MKTIVIAMSDQEWDIVLKCAVSASQLPVPFYVVSAVLQKIENELQAASAETPGSAAAVQVGDEDASAPMKPSRKK